MKKIMTLALLSLSFSSFAQMDYAVCGEYQLLASCGPFAANTPVLITEKGNISLDSSCPAERLELCNLRYSLVNLMIHKKRYCVWGKLNRQYQSPCADDSITINKVEEEYGF